MSNLRYEFESGYPYHVYNRGFEQQRIFFSDRDFTRFGERLQYLLDEHPDICLHAFCFLPNHFHLILSQTKQETGLADPKDRSRKGGISKFMHRLELAYTMYAKTKYKDDFPRWPFLEWRFKAKLIKDEEYLTSCMSYVCYNAIKHELVTDIHDWPWTSYHQIVDGVIEPHLPRVIPMDGVELVDYVDLDEE